MARRTRRVQVLGLGVVAAAFSAAGVTAVLTADDGSATVRAARIAAVWDDERQARFASEPAAADPSIAAAEDARASRGSTTIVAPTSAPPTTGSSTPATTAAPRPQPTTTAAPTTTVGTSGGGDGAGGQDAKPSAEDDEPARTPKTCTLSGRAAEAMRMLNTLRAEHGAAALRVACDATAKAQRHAEKMAADGQLTHSDLDAGIAAGWTRLGENVVKDHTLEGAYDQLWGEPAHRANMLDRGFDEAGIGVVDRDGTLWLVQMFVQR